MSTPRKKTYQVVSSNPVMVDYPDGNSVSHPAGTTFGADPSNPSVMRLLRIHSIREVSAREIPNFKVS